jgi:hypothetical protein
MPKILEIRNNITVSDQRRLESLEAQWGAMLDQLCNDPTNEVIARQMRHIDVDIVRITGEKIMDY